MTPHQPYITKPFRQAFAVLLCALAMATCALAQTPDVEIYWNELDKRDTLIDFDVTLEGYPVYRTFTVHNRGSFAVSIPEQLVPFFVIINTPDVAPENPRKEEFGPDERVFQFPWIVAPNSTRTFSLVFKARDDLFPPDLVTEALLFLRVVPASNPTASAPHVDKVFRLRALKTTHPLASNSNTLAFDSVYVRPSPVPTLSYRIRNVTQAYVTVDSQVIKRRTQLTTVPPELQVTVFDTAVFAPRDSIVWTATYEPVNQGLDSLTFITYYRLNASSATDSVVVEVAGTGVEQRLRLDASSFVGPDSASVRDSSSTGIVVDFGEVPANGTTYTATVIIQNVGNLNLGYDDERQVGPDPSAFSIQQPWSSGSGKGLRRGEFDTLVVAFTPVSSGEQQSSFVLTTDIKRRNIKGVPDGANRYTVYLRGFGERPQLQAPALLDFGRIVFRPGCLSNSIQTLRIANVGNATLDVDSVIINEGSGTIQFGSSTKFTIGIGGSVEIPVEYQPASVGADSGVITLWTNAVTSRVDVLYRAEVVPRDSTHVGVPPRTTAKPGQAVAIPILVQGSSVRLTNLTSFTITFDPSLMRFNSLVTLGTSSEGAVVLQATEAPRGVLKVSLDKSGNFLEKDTLVLVRFDTYLGDKISAGISLANETTTFGSSGCNSVLDVRTTSGVFALDSICGLDYKTSGSSLAIRAAVFPNPTVDFVTIAVSTPDTTHVVVSVRDALGRIVSSRDASSSSRDVSSSEVSTCLTADILPGAATLIPLNLAGLQTGTYYIEIRSLYASTTLPVVVRP